MIETYTAKNNAKRAAEKMINAGTAPSINYRLVTRGDGRFEIVWKTGPQDSEASNDVNEENLAEEPEPTQTAVSAENPFPDGSRVQVRIGMRRVVHGMIDYRVDTHHWRVLLDGDPTSTLHHGQHLKASDVPAPGPKKKRARRPWDAPSGDRKPGKSAGLDAAAARGVMPAKPICTSEANRKQYQPKFDQLEKWALADGWDAIRGYEVKGVNSYAKMVRQYRDRLLAAHAAASSAEEAA